MNSTETKLAERKITIITERYPAGLFERAELELTVVKNKVTAMRWVDRPIWYADILLEDVYSVFALMGAVKNPQSLTITGATAMEVYQLIYATPLTVIGADTIHIMSICISNDFKMLKICQTFGDIFSTLGIEEKDWDGWVWYSYPSNLYSLRLINATGYLYRDVKAIGMSYRRRPF